MSVQLIDKQEDIRLDKELVAQRFNRALNSYHHHAVVQQNMANHLAHMIKTYLPATHPCKVLELGCGSGLQTEALLKVLTIQNYCGNDLVANSMLKIKSLLNGHCTDFSFFAGDLETITLPTGFDLLVSGATFQWVSDLQRLAYRLSETLNPGGYLAFSTFGPANYQEVATTIGPQLHYPTMPEVLHSFSPYFETVAHNEWQTRLWFDAPKEVLVHMQQTGVGGMCGGSQGVAMARQLLKHYPRSAQGCPLTYHPMVVLLQLRSADLYQ